MSDTAKSIQHSDPSSKISIDQCAKFVPNRIYNFFTWLMDGPSYREVTRCADDNTSKNAIGTISISHDIIAKSRSILSPITLDWSLYTHHEFGSKQLLQERHAVGHSIADS